MKCECEVSPGRILKGEFELMAEVLECKFQLRTEDLKLSLGEIVFKREFELRTEVLKDEYDLRP